MKKTPSLLIAIFLVVVAAPTLVFGGVLLLNYLHKGGLDINPNFAGGKLLAAFPDASEHQIQTLPPGITPEASGSLDVTAFSVRKQDINPLSGFGIDSRLNFVFDFHEKLLNPERSAAGFSLPVILVQVDAPDRDDPASTVACFDSLKPDFIVVIDGARGRARIFNGCGIFLADGIDLYVDDSKIPHRPNQKPLEKGDRIIASLPLSAFGDVEAGVWRYG